MDKEKTMYLKQGEKDFLYIIHLLVITNIVILIFYSTLRNPFEYSLSMIGNLFEPIFLMYFISWSLFFSGSIYFVVMKMYEKTDYNNKRGITLLRMSCFFLIVTTLIPARREMPVIRGIHIGFSVIYILLFTISFHPFVRHVVKGKKIISIFLITWMTITWPGAIVVLLVVGWNAIYQLTYFINILLLLLFLGNYILRFSKVKV